MYREKYRVYNRAAERHLRIPAGAGGGPGGRGERRGELGRRAQPRPEVCQHLPPHLPRQQPQRHQGRVLRLQDLQDRLAQEGDAHQPPAQHRLSGNS